MSVFISAIKSLLQTFVSGIITDDISGVVNAYEHALLGKFPRARYIIGRDAKLLWLPLQALPTKLGDLLIKMQAKDPAIPRSVK